MLGWMPPLPVWLSWKSLKAAVFFWRRDLCGLLEVVKATFVAAAGLETVGHDAIDPVHVGAMEDIPPMRPLEARNGMRIQRRRHV